MCVLKEGDDFGDLALVNDAPRSASIIVAEPNCHFVKVDKVDFIRILQVRSEIFVLCRWLLCSITFIYSYRFSGHKKLWLCREHFAFEPASELLVLRVTVCFYL